MSKVNFKKISEYSLGIWISSFIGLLFYPIITRIISINDFGKFSIFNTYLGLFTTFGMFGMDQSLVRFFYTYKMEKRHKLIYLTVSVPLIFSVFVNIILIILSYLKIIDLTFLQISLFFIACVVSVLNIFAINILRLEDNSKVYAVVNILNKVLNLVLSLFFIKLLNMNFNALIYAIILSSLTCVIISVISTFKDWKVESNSTHTNNEIRAILMYSIPITLIMGFNWINTSVGRLLLQHFSNLNEVAIYSAANTLTMPLIFIQNAFLIIWFPLAIKVYENEEYETTVSFLEKANSIISLLTYIATISILLFRNIISNLLLSSSYTNTSSLVGFLLFGVISKILSDITGIGMQFKNRMVFNIYVSIISTTLNLTLCILTIPIYKSAGASISLAISSILYYALRTLFSVRCYKVNFNLMRNVVIQLLILIYSLAIFLYKSVSVDFLSIIILLLILFVYRKELALLKYLAIDYINKKVE